MQLHLKGKIVENKLDYDKAWALNVAYVRVTPGKTMWVYRAQWKFHFNTVYFVHKHE